MHTILIFSVIISLSVTASAIKCYTCESVDDPECGEDFDDKNYFKLDCSLVKAPHYLGNDFNDEISTACMKRIYKENGVQRIVRSCFFGDVNDTDIGCRFDPTLDDVETIGCQVCADDDYCNAATEQQKTFWATQMSLVAFILVAKFLHCKIV